MRLRHASLSAAALLLTTSLASAQTPGLTITWAEDDANPRTWDPRVTQSRHETQLIYQVFDQLVGSDEKNDLFPGLATSWSLSSDGLALTMKLRTADDWKGS